MELFTSCEFYQRNTGISTKSNKITLGVNCFGFVGHFSSINCDTPSFKTQKLCPYKTAKPHGGNDLSHCGLGNPDKNKQMMI